MEIAIILWLLFGLCTAVVMSNKGRSGFAGFVLGLLLGPIGLIIALVLRPDSEAQEQEELQSGSMKKCPYCAELIRVEAIKCRHCGSELQKPLTPELAAQLEFSPAELEVYGIDQLATLEKILSGDDVAAQGKVCETICTKIGRQPFEGPPKDFLRAYHRQLEANLEAGQG